MLPSVGSKRVKHNLATKQQQKGVLKFLPFLKLRLCGPLQTYCPLGSVASMLKVEDCRPQDPLPLPSRGPTVGEALTLPAKPCSGWGLVEASGALPRWGGTPCTIPAPPPQVLASPTSGTRRPVGFPDSAHSCVVNFFLRNSSFSNYPIWLCHLSPAWTPTEP